MYSGKKVKDKRVLVRRKWDFLKWEEEEDEEEEKMNTDKEGQKPRILLWMWATYALTITLSLERRDHCLFWGKNICFPLD